MPDGKTHDNLWKYGQALAYPAGVLLSMSDWHIGLGAFTGYLIGRFITPDADLVGITHGEGEIMRRFGCLGGLLVSYYTFYGFIFRGKHRSFWTHGLLISTAIRFIYTFWWLAWFLYNKEWLTDVVYLYGFGIFIGMAMADIIHILADLAVSDSSIKSRKWR